MTAASEERINWRLLLGCWALVVTLVYLPMLPHAGGILPFTDNDDVMRMVTAGDLANGQGWQDTIEHRDDAPFGMPMHWSRLVDAPIAALLVLLRPLFGAVTGQIVQFIWPPVMLLALLALSVGLTRRVLGPGHQLPALLLPALSIVVLGEFSPGRVDHHNVQMILTTALVWATLSGRASLIAAIAAGLLAATSLAIGIETLPFIVGAVLAFSLFWIVDAAAGRNVRWFGAAFAVGTAGHLVLATPPSAYFVAACDQLSDTYVVAAVLVAAALTVATLAGGKLPRSGRLVLIAVLAAIAAATTLMLFPACRAGPYGGLDARAYELLIAHVPEAQPLWSWITDGDIVGAVSYTSICFIGLAVTAWCAAIARDARRTDWVVLLLYLGLAMIVMILQVRGARLAVMPAIPAGVWLVSRVRTAFAARGRWPQGAAMAASWVLVAGLVQYLVPTLVSGLVASTPAAAATSPAAGAYPDCVLPSAFDKLAALPKGIVIGPPSIGARILRYTPHAVVSAGYHRNVDGTIDTDDFLNAGEAAARAVAAKRGVGYVVACRGLAQLDPHSYTTPDSFIVEWNAGRHWSWLVPVSDPADRLQIYKVDLDR